MRKVHAQGCGMRKVHARVRACVRASDRVCVYICVNKVFFESINNRGNIII